MGHCLDPYLINENASPTQFCLKNKFIYLDCVEWMTDEYGADATESASKKILDGADTISFAHFSIELVQSVNNIHKFTLKDTNEC